MVTAAELSVEEEMRPLREIATRRGWALELVSPTSFTLALPAKDGSIVQILADCEGYPVLPPAWHFRNAMSGALDKPADSPSPAGFFHGSGVICAPWNRLAYAPSGPHGDWQIGDWKANQHTRGTKTLAAMALRIAVELQGRYVGRRG